MRATIPHTGRLPFEYEAAEDDGRVTAYGGLPLVVETMRSLGVDKSVRRNVHVRKRRRLHDEAALIEAFVLLMAVGGECLEDFDLLREDKALERLLGRPMPSKETARKFLYDFHDERLIEAARAALSPGEVAYIPEENAPLRGLAQVQQDLLRSVAGRGNSKRATVDLDATIQESHKREAKPHYEGGRGYQPAVAIWAEQDLVLADEFRDGNVPAGKATLRLTQRAFAALPASVTERRFRGDSAMYNDAQLKWLVSDIVRTSSGARLPEKIDFTISADMTQELRAICVAVPDREWSHLEQRLREDVHLSEVEFTPGNWPKDAAPLRYLAIRFTPTQGNLFERDAGPKYLAVVTNRKGGVAELIRWHWQKAGTIEHVHHVVKNELGGGVLPCGRFGANAAWFRLALLTYNVLSALKTIGLTPNLQDARPKRLRLVVFAIPAVVVTHARSLIARVIDRARRATEILAARARLWAASPGAA